jgi:hypothetical protein
VSYASRHSPLKWKFRPRSFDVNVAKAYSELPEASQLELDARAAREARGVLQHEENERGSMTLAVYRCELELERREQWEALVLKGCASRLQELATQEKGDDGPEERLDWAQARVGQQRGPGWKRPKTIGEWLARFAGPRGGEPEEIAAAGTKKASVEP